MEKIITINTKKTASDTALVQLSPGNALDTVDPSISINKWSTCYCFLSRSFRSLLNFSNSNYYCFIHLFTFFFSECILPGSMFWGLWSPRNYNSLNFYIVFITRITLSQSHQFPLTNKQCSVAQLQADWTSAPNTICCLSSCFLAVLATFLTIVRRETSKMFHHYSLRKHLKLVPRSSRLKNAELLKSSVKYGKILPNLVNSSSLCWIMRVILANQKRKNILNEYRRLHLSVHTRRKNMFWLSANMTCQFPSFSLSSGWRKEERAWEGDFCHSSSCGQIGPWDKNINEKK